MRTAVLSVMGAIILTLALTTSGGGAGTGHGHVIRYAVLAWNDLGMHCMDRDYSVFAILPPYNNLRAQVLDRFTGKLVTTDVTLTYEATEDTRGSINTTSIGKTNFWDWVLSLFGVQPAVDIGLTGNPVESRTPAPMTYDAAHRYWKADGIPQVPYDDAGTVNYYPMVKVVVRDRMGNYLTETKTVLPVSDEMTCVHCHASGTGDPMAQPNAGWINDPDPEKDWKKNILLRHDDRNLGKPVYASALAQLRYNPAGLFTTAAAGQPILCAACHASNALGTNGVQGIKPLTASMHSWHATQAMDDATGMPLDTTTNRSACYYCHPGSTTQCLRGAMGNAVDSSGNMILQCQSCHGSMSTVGASTREGWKDLPKCQYCHYWSAGAGTYVRDTSAVDGSGNFKSGGTSVFSSGQELYKVGAEHGKVQCEACHGSTHAEYPSSEPNDNVQSVALQGYAGTVTECNACHQVVPMTANGGPHGMHTVGQSWIYAHTYFAKTSITSCAACHGSDYLGAPSSRTATNRTFTVTRTATDARGFRKIDFPKGTAIGCKNCHDCTAGRI